MLANLVLNSAAPANGNVAAPANGPAAPSGPTTPSEIASARANGAAAGIENGGPKVVKKPAANKSPAKTKPAVPVKTKPIERDLGDTLPVDAHGAYMLNGGNRARNGSDTESALNGRESFVREGNGKLDSRQSLMSVRSLRSAAPSESGYGGSISSRRRLQRAQMVVRVLAATGLTKDAESSGLVPFVSVEVAGKEFFTGPAVFMGGEHRWSDQVFTRELRRRYMSEALIFCQVFDLFTRQRLGYVTVDFESLMASGQAKTADLWLALQHDPTKMRGKLHVQLAFVPELIEVVPTQSSGAAARAAAWAASGGDARAWSTMSVDEDALEDAATLAAHVQREHLKREAALPQRRKPIEEGVSADVGHSILRFFSCGCACDGADDGSSANDLLAIAASKRGVPSAPGANGSVASAMRPRPSGPPSVAGGDRRTVQLGAAHRPVFSLDQIDAMAGRLGAPPAPAPAPAAGEPAPVVKRAVLRV